MIHIAVLFHRNQGQEVVGHYVINELAHTWRSRGDRVTYLFGTQTYVPADILIVHVDLSMVPEPYLEFAAQYPVVLNGELSDIRKVQISQNLVALGDEWRGPVVVKSDLNSSGQPERTLSASWIERQSGLARKIAQAGRRLRSPNMPRREASIYTVFDSTNDIPSRWFDYGATVVERFLPEIENDLYHLRMVQILGDRRVGTRLASPEPIVKAASSIATTEMEPHPMVDEWCARLHVDYGKLDYVLHEGEAVLLDVNKTTGSNSSYRESAVLARSRQHLAEGLYSYLG